MAGDGIFFILAHFKSQSFEHRVQMKQSFMLLPKESVIYMYTINTINPTGKNQLDKLIRAWIHSLNFPYKWMDNSVSKFTVLSVFPGTGLEKTPHGNDCVITEMHFLVELKGNGYF